MDALETLHRQRKAAEVELETKPIRELEEKLRAEVGEICGRLLPSLRAVKQTEEYARAWKCEHYEEQVLKRAGIKNAESLLLAAQKIRATDGYISKLEQAQSEAAKGLDRPDVFTQPSRQSLYVYILGLAEGIGSDSDVLQAVKSFREYYAEAEAALQNLPKPQPIAAVQPSQLHDHRNPARSETQFDTFAA